MLLCSLIRLLPNKLKLAIWSHLTRLLHPTQGILDGEGLSQNQWLEFIKGDIWKALLFEIQERELYLIELFKDHDQLWNPDTIRGKLTELEFFKQVPKSLIAALVIKEANQRKKEEDDAEDNA